MDALTALEKVLGDLTWRLKRVVPINEGVANIMQGIGGFDKERAGWILKGQRIGLEDAIFDLMTVVEEVKQEQQNGGDSHVNR